MFRDMALTGAVAMGHLFLRRFLAAGDRAVDCTCGNGNDTLLLAQLVGDQGRVWAMDIQENAVAATENLLVEGGVRERVQLVKGSHERLAEYVKEPVKAVIFNLGYLPGGDKGIKTGIETTLAALDQATCLLLPGGMILCVVYPGHEGGQEEGKAIETWGSTLGGKTFNVWKQSQLNRRESAPYLVMVQKNKAGA